MNELYAKLSHLKMLYASCPDDDIKEEFERMMIKLEEEIDDLGKEVKRG